MAAVVHRLDPGAYAATLRRQVLIQSAAALLATVVGLAVAWRSPLVRAYGAAAAVGTSAVVTVGWIALVWRWQARVLRRRWASYRLALGASALRVVEAGAAPVEIARGELAASRDLLGGLLLVAERPRRALFVPRAVERFAEVRAAVSQWIGQPAVSDEEARAALAELRAVADAGPPPRPTAASRRSWIILLFLAGAFLAASAWQLLSSLRR